MYDMEVASQSAIALVAQLASLAGTVVVVGKVVMNLVERFSPNAPKKSTSSSALELVIRGSP